jgi:septal ring factor EnvC (AmiA/AmiB activator)
VSIAGSNHISSNRTSDPRHRDSEPPHFQLTNHRQEMLDSCLHKRYEDMRDRAENAAQRKQFVHAITELKAQMEACVPEEQEAQMRKTELEQQSRIEQAKLGQLQDELDRLDQAVMNAALHAASAHP